MIDGCSRRRERHQLYYLKNKKKHNLDFLKSTQNPIKDDIIKKPTLAFSALTRSLSHLSSPQLYILYCTQLDRYALLFRLLFLPENCDGGARSRSPPRRRSIPKVRSYVPTIDRHLLFRNKAKSYPRYRYDTTGTVDIINIMHTTRRSRVHVPVDLPRQRSRMPLRETGRRATRLHVPTGKGEKRPFDVCPFAPTTVVSLHPLHT